MLTPFTAFLRRGIPLKLCVIAVVAGALACVTCLNILYMRQESVSVAQKSAAQVFELIALQTNREISRLMQPITELVKAEAQAAVQEGGFTLEQARQMFTTGALQALTLRPMVLSLNYGYADGSFFGLVSLKEENVRQHFECPPGAAFVSWVVTRSADGASSEYHTFYSSDFAEILTKEVPLRYDPRERIWYKAAMDSGALTSTDPYIFPMTKELGITVAEPMTQGNGVFSINILLRSFTELFNATPLSDQGYLFLLDEAKRIIAARAPLEESHESNVAPLLPVHLYNVPAVAGGSGVLESCFSSDRPLEIHENDQLYFAACKGIPLPQGTLYVVMISPMDAFSGFMENFFKNTALFSLGTMAVFLLLTLWMAYHVRASLMRLLHEILHLEDPKPTGRPSGRSRVFELRRLSAAVNLMRQRVARHRTSTQPLMESMERQAREYAEQLREAREQTQAALDGRNRFLATVSYEIRTPINAIMGFTRLFGVDNLNDMQRAYLHRIHDSSVAMLHIINGILDLAKLETGRLELDYISFHLRTLLDAVNNQLAARLKECELSLTIYVEPHVPDVLCGDPTRLHQILLHLLDTAAKTIPSGGISLSVRANTACAVCEADHRLTLEFQIIDTAGAGTEEGMRRMLAPLVREGTSHRRYGEAGLGLTVCRGLVEMMGGVITGEAIPGQGCAYRFSVVVEAQDVHAAHLPRNAEKNRPARWRRNRVLVVDDDESTREIIAAMLEHFHISADLAKNGMQALELAKKNSYSMVFMDIEMPHMNGLEATRRLRAQEAEAKHDSGCLVRTPVVALTANALEEDKLNCLRAGMDGHLAKPVMPEQVEAMLHAWIPIDADKGSA